MSGKFSFLGMALYTAGNMIGTGTHQTLNALARDGCGNLLWANFLLAGLLASLSSLPLFHLYGKHPADDCLLVSAEAGFGRRWGSFIALVNGHLVSMELLFAVTMQVSFFGDAAAAQTPFGDWAGKVAAVVLLLVLWMSVRARGALFTARIAFWLGVLELSTVGLLVLSSFLAWRIGRPLRPVSSLFDASETKWDQFSSGIHVAIFAYGGFPGMIQSGDLVRQPARDVPLGIVLACILTMCIYVLMSASVLLVAEPASIQSFETGFDSLQSIVPDVVLKGISLTVLSSVANNIMENSLVIISNLTQMVSSGTLAFLDLGLCRSDSVTFGSIILLTIFKDSIGLRFLGDAIDFALLLQFAILAILSISLMIQERTHLKIIPPVLSLMANCLLGIWHCYHASLKPMLLLLIFCVLLPLIYQLNSKGKVE